MHYLADRIGRGLAEIRSAHPDWLVGIRQNGVVIGLEFNHPTGAKAVMRRLCENGVWAIFSTLDPRVLQFKPGILVDSRLADEILDRTETAVALSRDDVAVTARACVTSPGGPPRRSRRMTWPRPTGSSPR